MIQVDEENFGQTVSIELRPGGKDTRVSYFYIVQQQNSHCNDVKDIAEVLKVIVKDIVKYIVKSRDKKDILYDVKGIVKNIFYGIVRR